MTSVSPYSDIQVERSDAVAIVTICRGEARNACRRQTLEEAHHAISAERANGARVIVITGSGEHAFSAGADLKELRVSTHEEKDAFLRDGWGRLLDGIESGTVPVIAAIRGYAVGGGMELALACHLRVVGSGAKLGLPEILRGHIPGAGGTVRFPRLVGTGIALQYLLTGEMIDAAEAYRIGLANVVVPDQDVLQYAVGLANKIATLSRPAVEMTLRSVMAQRELDLDAALTYERTLCSEMRKAKDYQEGLDAFAGKRVPKYE